MAKYIIPIPNDVKWTIENPTGELAHENFIVSRYAIDFIVPLKTPVIAARAGIAFAIKSDSQKWGLDAKAEDANFVVIDHGDGTYAEYIHLGYKEVFVKPGQEVRQGQVIGLIGNSGKMVVPHLHFNLFKIENKKVESIAPDFD